MALWTPAEITTALWLDADDASTIALSGASVTEWHDKSGNAKHHSQATGSKQPTYSATGFNGKGSISFDGGDDLRNAIGLTSGTYIREICVFWVATRDTSGGGTIFAERLTSLVCIAQFLSNAISSDGANVTSNHSITGTDYAKISTGGGIAAHFHLPNARDRFWINGQSIVVSNNVASNVSGNVGSVIGNRGDANQFWTGKIMEVIVMTIDPGTFDRQKTEGYLAWKWGFTASLPSDHPYNAAAPVLAASGGFPLSRVLN